MTIDKVPEAMHQQPFHTFVDRTVVGQAYAVRHPDFIAMSTNGRIMTIFDDAGQHIIDVRLVSEIMDRQIQESRLPPHPPAIDGIRKGYG
jgi:hypothetical protein